MTTSKRNLQGLPGGSAAAVIGIMHQRLLQIYSDFHEQQLPSRAAVFMKNLMQPPSEISHRESAALFMLNLK